VSTPGTATEPRDSERSETIAGILGDAARTGSRLTLVLGLATLAGLVLVAVLGLLAAPPDDVMGDTVRIIYVHVPAALGAYAALGVTAFGSVIWLLRRSVWWDMVAHAGAEVGVILCGVTLVTGMLWGRPTWGTYWEWGDVRLVTTLILFVVMVGYLSVRSLGGDHSAVATRAAVIGLIGGVNIVIVNRSVNWWANRTLHQQSSLTDGKLEDLTLFTLFLAIIVTATAISWMLVHRVRTAWLEHQLAEHDLRAAMEARHAEVLRQ